MAETRTTSTEAVQPPRPFRRWLLPSIKIGLAVGLLWYAFAQGLIKFEPLRRLMATPSLLILALITMSCQMMIGAQRLRILLAPLDVRLSYFHSLRLTYLGAFFDVFLVTSVGGDAIKAVYLARETPSGRRMQAVSVLVLDRLMGLLGLLTLTFLMALINLSVLWHDKSIRPWLLMLVGVCAFFLLGTAALLSKRVYRSAFMQGLMRFLPFGTMLDRAYASLQQFSGHPRQLCESWFLSLLVHVCGVLTGYCLLIGINGANVPAIGPFFVAWLISNFVCSFMAFGAIGFGQLAYDEVFAAIASMKAGSDLATAVQAVCIIAKLPGLIAWLVSREQRPQTAMVPESVPND